MFTNLIFFRLEIASIVVREGIKNVVRLVRDYDRIEIEVDANGNQGEFGKNRAAGG